jgi:phage terminase small subunit
MKNLKSTPKHSIYPKAPSNLTAAASVKWDEINRGWVLDESARMVLGTALEAWDRMKAAQAGIKKHGLMLRDRFGQLRSNPLCTVERDSRAAWLSGLKMLSLDMEPLRERPGRPPK